MSLSCVAILISRWAICGHLAAGRLVGGRNAAFGEVRHVHHGADEMFDLVADVERYHEFVPLCLRHAFLSGEPPAETEILMTDMTVACGIYRESFTSRVTLDRA